MERLVSTAVALGGGFLVEGVLFFMIIADVITCEHVMRFLLGLVICVGILSWTLLWIKRVERVRGAARKEGLLKDRPPARQHRVHPSAFTPAAAPAAPPPLTHKQLFQPDHLLRTLLPRRQVALCEVHQYNTACRPELAEAESLSVELSRSLQRSKSVPLVFSVDTN